MLLRDRGFATVAILTLALGIGVNVAMWAVADEAIFRGLPYDDPEKLLVVWRDKDTGNSRTPLSIPEFEDLRTRQRACESVALARPATFNLTDLESPKALDGLMVTSGFLKTLGVTPVLGRAFSSDDDRRGAPKTILLSHELWVSQFGNDPSILDDTVRLDRESYVVIGILPPGIQSEPLGYGSIGSFLVPIMVFADQLPMEDRADRRTLATLCRLLPEMTRERAREDLKRIAAELEAEYPVMEADVRLVDESIHDHVFGDVRSLMWPLLGAVLLVLVIAAANLTHLLLTRLADRTEEFQTREALGASRNRLARQLLCESLVLGVLGGLSGLLIGHWFLKLLPILFADFESLQTAQVEGLQMFWFLVLAMLASLIVGLLPGLQGLRQSGRLSFLRARGSTRSHRSRWALVSLEVAIGLVTLVGATLMLRTMAEIRSIEPGFITENVLTVKVIAPDAVFRDRPRWTAYFDEALGRLKRLPGVEHAASSSVSLLGGSIPRGPTAVADRALPTDGKFKLAHYQMVSPGFFEALGIPILEGRDFTALDDDRANAERVVVISERLARHYWSEGPPWVGRQLAFEFDGSQAEPIPRWRRVIGVVGEIRAGDPRSDPQGAAYVPYTQVPTWNERFGSPEMTFVVIGSDQPLGLANDVRRELLDIDSERPVYGLATLEEILHRLYANLWQVSTLLTVFAALALLLSIGGIYGVVSYIVTAGTREFGIRMAMGASPKQILWNLLRQSVRAVTLGLAVGLAGVYWILAPLLESLLYGVGPLSPLSIIGSAALLVVVALLATLIPALRVVRLEPSKALHHE